MEAAEDIGRKDFNLLCVGNLDWDHDMAPWYCPPLSPKDAPCTGGADEYLKLLLDDIIPECLKEWTERLLTSAWQDIPLPGFLHCMRCIKRKFLSVPPVCRDPCGSLILRNMCFHMK